ncbi:hypothetical protein FOLKNPGA_00085 [Legionella sp. PC1000]|nr:hypothetical protein FOLKNPGA_00085 [Legionella sp. PC1000]
MAWLFFTHLVFFSMPVWGYISVIFMECWRIAYSLMRAIIAGFFRLKYNCRILSWVSSCTNRNKLRLRETPEKWGISLLYSCSANFLKCSSDKRNCSKSVRGYAPIHSKNSMAFLFQVNACPSIRQHSFSIARRAR